MMICDGISTCLPKPWCVDVEPSHLESRINKYIHGTNTGHQRDYQSLPRLPGCTRESAVENISILYTPPSHKGLCAHVNTCQHNSADCLRKYDHPNKYKWINECLRMQNNLPSKKISAIQKNTRCAWSPMNVQFSWMMHNTCKTVWTSCHKLTKPAVSFSLFNLPVSLCAHHSLWMSDRTYTNAWCESCIMHDAQYPRCTRLC